MKVKVGIWDHLSRFVLFLLFVAGLVGVFFWYLPLIQENQKYRQRILALEAQIAREEARVLDYKRHNYALQHQPEAVERAAREILGYARPGEIILKFEDGQREELKAEPSDPWRGME